MPYTFRRAVPADAEIMTELRFRMRQERETVQPPADMASFRASCLAYFQTALRGRDFHSFLAVSEEGAAAAMGSMCLEVHPPSYSVPDGRIGVILNIYTLPEHRKQGLGGKIVALLLDEARTLGLYAVTLNASPAGRPLYEKAGFKVLDGEMILKLK